MPPRANWKGYLRLSLVSCPIALYPASSLNHQQDEHGRSRSGRTDPQGARHRA
jgi:hypothetical protein